MFEWRLRLLAPAGIVVFAIAFVIAAAAALSTPAPPHGLSVRQAPAHTVRSEYVVKPGDDLSDLNRAPQWLALR